MYPTKIKDVLDKVAQETVSSLTKAVPRTTYTGICRPDCNICNGLGWVKLSCSLDPSDEDFGRLHLCPNAKNRHLKVRCGLYQDEVDELDWSKIRKFGNSVEIADSVKAILERGYGLAYMWGGHGLAKTLIQKVAVAVSVRAGKQAYYAMASDILDQIRDAYNETDPRDSALERLERWSSTYLLCIDELERISETGWAKEKVFQLLDRRHVSAIRQETITIIASNSSPDDLDSALADRFRDGRHSIFRMHGKSARPSMPDGFRY